MSYAVTPEELAAKLKDVRNIFVVSGAGLSAESGIPTYRDTDGSPLNMAPTVRHFETDPKTFHWGREGDEPVVGQNESFQLMLSDKIEPNAAHIAIARLTQEFNGAVTVVTQNVDNLLERAGAVDVLHIHGKFWEAQCHTCKDVFSRVTGDMRNHVRFDDPERWSQIKPGDLSDDMVCDQKLPGGRACGATGGQGIRPHVVLFTEQPRHTEEIIEALPRTDLYLAIGTSGVVSPIADFPRWLKGHACEAVTVEVNIKPTNSSDNFDYVVEGPASVTMPALVDLLLRPR